MFAPQQKKISRLDGFLAKIHQLSENNRDKDSEKPVLVAIDGRCASGKTSLCASLQRQFGWQVVHMDNFYLRPEQRTPERYAAPGGNVDYERVFSEVLHPLEKGRRAVYRPLDCATLRLSEQEIPVEPSGIVLVEGAYACHPTLWDCYALRAFMTVSPETQRQRIARRNGEEKLRVFLERWIPLEEMYISAYQLEHRCDYRLETDE